MADSMLTQSAEQERAARRRSEGHEGPGAARAAEHPVLRLQRQVGNSLVARMIAQREAAGEEELQARHDPALAEREAAEEEELQARHDPALAQREAAEEEEEMQATHDPALAQREAAEEEELQARHDPALAQREAAEEEEELQAKHDPALAQREAAEEEELQAKHDPALAQREAAEEEELQAKHDPALAQREAAEEEELQAKHAPEVGLEGGAVSDSLANRINAKRGGGSPLDDGIRGQMENAMGTSFKDVRVHRDAEADDLNRSITAKAFTTGNDVFLREDVPANDQSVLAHELTHVVQQRSMGGSGGGMHVGAAGDSHEEEADQVAQMVTSGATTQRHTDEEHQ